MTSRRTTGWTLGVLLGLLGLTPLVGATPLSLEEVLGSTRERYPGMEAARQGIATAEAELLAARGRFDTRVRTQGSVMPLGYYQRERLDAVIEQPLPLLGTRLFAGYRLGRGDFPVYYGEYETLTRGELRAGLELSLWRNGLVDPRRAGVSQARLRRELATFTFAGERLELQRSAAYQYWDWVAAGRRLRIAEAQYALAVARHEQLARRVAAGDIPEIEHTENERVLLGRDAARVAARRALQRTALSLSLYLRDARGEPHVVEPVRLPESIPVPETALEAELGTWIDRALRDRPELRELALQGEVLQVDVDLARNQAAPAVDLGLSVARDVGAGPDSLRPTEFQASLTLDIPLQAREARGKRRSAEAKRAAVEARARLERDRIIMEVRDTLSALEASHARVGLVHRAAEVARRLAQAELTRFEHGATSLLIVNQREQAAAEAEVEEVNAQVDYQRAVVDLLTATVALEPRPEGGATRE